MRKAGNFIIKFIYISDTHKVSPQGNQIERKPENSLLVIKLFYFTLFLNAYLQFVQNQSQNNVSERINNKSKLSNIKIDNLENHLIKSEGKSNSANKKSDKNIEKVDDVNEKVQKILAQRKLKRLMTKQIQKPILISI